MRNELEINANCLEAAIGWVIMEDVKFSKKVYLMYYFGVCASLTEGI